MLSSKRVFEELVLRSLRALPLMKPFATPGGGGGGGGGGAARREILCVLDTERFKSVPRKRQK